MKLWKNYKMSTFPVMATHIKQKKFPESQCDYFSFIAHSLRAKYEF